MLTNALRRRAGFTLVEVLTGALVSAVVGVATLTLTVRHERLARALDGMLATRRALREGGDVLRYDLRALAPHRQDIYAIGETFIDFRVVSGFSVLCAVDPARSLISIPARSPSVPSLTSWIVAPDAGDSVAVLLPAPNPDSATWAQSALAAAATRGPPCPSGFADAGDSTGSQTLRLTVPLPPGVGIGAAVRIFRHARYELYRAGDGAWYLGFLDCLATRATPCAVVQPVAGPYSARGILFRFFDSTGAPTTVPSLVARIDVAMRSFATLGPSIPGLPAVFADSVLLTVSPRN